MRPAELFRFCPRCGAARAAENVGQIPLRCGPCGFTFFFNPTVAAAAFVFGPDERVLFIRREKEPAAGKLGIPGGFIDIGETAEDALRREVREEVGIEIEGASFLMSCPNLYPYREVTYPVVDLVFTARAVDPAAARPLDAVTGIEWHPLATVDENELAFPSMKVSLAALRGPAARG